MVTTVTRLGVDDSDLETRRVHTTYLFWKTSRPILFQN